MFSIGKNWDGKIFGIADSAGSVVNTDWNFLLKGNSTPKLIQFEKKEYIFSYRTVQKLWKLDEK